MVTYGELSHGKRKKHQQKWFKNDLKIFYLDVHVLETLRENRFELTKIGKDICKYKTVLEREIQPKFNRIILPDIMLQILSVRVVIISNRQPAMRVVCNILQEIYFSIGTGYLSIFWDEIFYELFNKVSA